MKEHDPPWLRAFAVACVVVSVAGIALALWLAYAVDWTGMPLP